MQALAQCMSERDAISVTSDAFVYRLKVVLEKCVDLLQNKDNHNQKVT
jgi:hypothetical protein